MGGVFNGYWYCSVRVKSISDVEYDKTYIWKIRGNQMTIKVPNVNFNVYVKYYSTCYQFHHSSGQGYSNARAFAEYTKDYLPSTDLIDVSLEWKGTRYGTCN